MQPVVQEEIHVLVIRVVTSGLNPFVSGRQNVSCGRNNINVNGCTHFILTSAANCTGAWRHLQIFQPTNRPLSVSLAIEWHLHWHLLDHRNIIFFYILEQNRSLEACLRRILQKGLLAFNIIIYTYMLSGCDSGHIWFLTMLRGCFENNV